MPKLGPPSGTEGKNYFEREFSVSSVEFLQILYPGVSFFKKKKKIISDLSVLPHQKPREEKQRQRRNRCKEINDAVQRTLCDGEAELCSPSTGQRQ